MSGLVKALGCDTCPGSACGGEGPGVGGERGHLFFFDRAADVSVISLDRAAAKIDRRAPATKVEIDIRYSPGTMLAALR